MGVDGANLHRSSPVLRIYMGKITAFYGWNFYEFLTSSHLQQGKKNLMHFLIIFVPKLVGTKTHFKSACCVIADL